MIYVALIVEDELSEAVMRRLLGNYQDKYEVVDSFNGHGFGYLKTNIKGFNQASLVYPHFMLTDLDRYECPLALINDWIDFPVHQNFMLTIAIKEVESWLLADVGGMSHFLNLSASIFPVNPEYLEDPKETLINLAKRSRKRLVRTDIVPINHNASIGPNYNGRLSEFVFNHWNIDHAAARSASLKRICMKLNDFVQH